METIYTIYTIPVTEAFSATVEDPKIGCPLCLLYRQVEQALVYLWVR